MRESSPRSSVRLNRWLRGCASRCLSDRLPKKGELALRRLRKSLPASLRKFIAEYHSGLSAELQSDPRFEFRLRVTNELAPKDGAILSKKLPRKARP
jgi:hypothetical protein